MDFAGGIDKAITRAKEYCAKKGKDLKIEIVLRASTTAAKPDPRRRVDRIMFDNFTPGNDKESSRDGSRQK